MKIIFYLFFLTATFFIVPGCSQNTSGIDPCSSPSCNGKDENDGSLDFQVADTTVFKIQLGKTYQTILAFGASDAWAPEIIGQNYPLPVKKRIAKKLFSKKIVNGTPVGIGLSGWRFQIGSDRGTTKSGFRSSSWYRLRGCFLSKGGTYDWSKQKGARWFLKQAKSYGVRHITGWLNSPPYFMTKTGYTYLTGNVHGYNLAPKHYDDYGDFLAHVAMHFRKLGMPFDVISPLNEPQWAWRYNVGDAKQSGSHATNKQISNVVKAINAAFEKYNVKSKIMIPEAGRVNFLYGGNINKTANEIKAFWSPSSLYYIGNLSHLSHYVTAHSYWTNKNVKESIDDRKNIAKRIKQIDPDLEYRQSEYSILGPNFKHTIPNAKPIDYALWIDRVIFNDLVYGNAVSWSFWTAISRGQPNRFGLFGWTPYTHNLSNSTGKVQAVKNLWASW